MPHTFRPYGHNCGSYCCYKNKVQRESHSQQQSRLPFVSSVLCQSGWVGKPPKPHTAGPCASGNRVEIPRAWGVAWIIRVDRHLHLPLQLLAPRSPEGQGPRFWSEPQSRDAHDAQGAFSVVSTLKSLTGSLPTYKLISYFPYFFLFVCVCVCGLFTEHVGSWFPNRELNLGPLQ